MSKRNIVRNILLSSGIFILSCACSLLFRAWGVQEHITTIFVFAVFVISLTTDGYLYGIVAAVIGMFAINYAFTYPYFTLSFTAPANFISAAIMLSIAILTGMLTTKVKRQEALKAESEKERMRANLLRAVSHDLRTPLTSIYSASSMLREKGAQLTQAQQNTMLKNIQEDSDWLVRMVENLLSITRIDSGKIKIDKTPTVLDELIDSVITKFANRYPQQRVTLDIPDTIVVIPMDTILIEQVIINILENAVLHAQGMTELSLRVFTLGKQAIFEIADNGCGLGEYKLNSAFSGLYMAQEEHADGSRRNSGIGLSVCATIVKAHGGEISVKNQKSGGAIFRFTLQTEGRANDE